MHYWLLFGVFISFAWSGVNAWCGEKVEFSFDSGLSDQAEWFGDHEEAEGVVGRSVMIRGNSLLRLADIDHLSTHNREKRGDVEIACLPVSCSMWVNVHRLNGDQQMLAAKNVYSLDEREWSLMIDSDGQFALYVYQDGWKIARSKVSPTPGRWYQVGFVLAEGRADLWVNGNLTASLSLEKTIPVTPAKVTLGGVDDNGRFRQGFYGAIDEVVLWSRAIDESLMRSNFKPTERMHVIPAEEPKYSLWSAGKIPDAQSLERLEGVRFEVIKRYEPELDGYGFLHGVALAWHKGRLFSSFGHNKGSENTYTEEGRFCVSDDSGATWSPVTTIDSGLEKDDLAVSHGVFLSHAGKLWAFLGSFYGTRKNVHTRAYVLNEDNDSWEPQGTVVEDGFWPMTEPVRMNNGNWVMPGFIVSDQNPPAVAVSRGDNLMSWDLHILPLSKDLSTCWGESSVVVSGSKLVNVARYGAQAIALVSESSDYGKTWSEVSPSNLPMSTSKPCCGTLSSGVRYLINSISADGGGRRSPLTIAIGLPSEVGFSKLYVIRDAVFEEGPGESDRNAALSYPYATEHDGNLYVGYSNNGPRRANNNSAEMAVIPIELLVGD